MLIVTPTRIEDPRHREFSAYVHGVAAHDVTRCACRKRPGAVDIPTMWGIISLVKLTLAQTATFASLWKYWRLGDDDLRALEHQVMENPLAGKVMRNTGGVRKIRFAPSSRGSGKSGAYRVCYFYFPAYEIVFFVLIFPKSEQPNLTAEQEKACRSLAKEISQALADVR